MTLLSPDAYKNMKTLTDRPDFTKRTLSFGQIPCFQYDKSLKDEIAALIAAAHQQYNRF